MVRLEERRKGFTGIVILGIICISWLVEMLESALPNPKAQNFVKSFREGQQVWIVRRGSNRASHFLELAVYTEDGWKGLILLPEGREGRGWSRVVGELTKTVDFLEATRVLAVTVKSTLAEKKLGSKTWSAVGGVCCYTR